MLDLFFIYKLCNFNYISLLQSQPVKSVFTKNKQTGETLFLQHFLGHFITIKILAADCSVYGG